MRRRMGGALAGCLCVISLLAGCTRQDEITRQYVPKVSQELMLEATPDQTVSAKVGEPTRMLAAALPRGRKTWFFKLTGPAEAVAEQQDRFKAFVESLRFPEGADGPEFDLPEGWQRLPGSGMRYATVRMGPPEAPMDLTIIPLPTGQGSLDEYLLANINRWREQLNLAKIGSLQFPDPSGEMWQMSVDGESTVTAVNLVGTFQGSDMQNMPNASSLPPDHPPIGSDAIPALPQAANSPITFKAPESWDVGKAGGMRAAAFAVSDGAAKAEITAISLPIAGGDRLENVNRWRDQVGLGPLTQEQLGAALEPIMVDGLEGQFVRILGSEDKSPRQAILGVLVDRGPLTWFFKLMGDAALAERETGNFQDFVRSVKFRPAASAADVVPQ